MAVDLTGIPRATVYGESASGGGGGVVSPVVPLHVDGLHFKRPDGSIFKYRGLTAFSAFDDWLKRRLDKLAAYAAWTRSLGLNTWRVFFVWNNLGLKPTDHHYYNEAVIFLEWLKGEGLYCHAVALCDQVSGSAVRLSKTDQIAHLRRFIEIARSTGNVLGENFNEARKNDDDDVCGLLASSMYSGAPWTRSWWDENASYTQVGPLIDFTTGHTDRGREWTRTFIQTLDVSRRGYGLPDGTPVPATQAPHILGEPRRIAEGTSPRQHADYQAGAALFGPGACLHGGFRTINPAHESDLQFCSVPSGVALACCEAVGAVHASTIWPANTPDGHYVRGGVNDRNEDNKPDCPILHRDRYFGGSQSRPAYEEPEGAARSFFIELGGTYYGLAVDPGPQWRLQVRPGFRLIAQGGYDDGVHGPNLLVLERS